MNDTEQAYESLNGLTADDFAAKVKEAGFPTTGPFAEAVWHALSGNRRALFSYSDALAMYERLGYKPFAGYPLQIVGQD